MKDILGEQIKAILSDLEAKKQVGVIELVFASGTKKMVKHQVVVGCTFFEAKESVRWSLIANGRYELPFSDSFNYSHRQPLFKNLYRHKVRNAEFLHGFLLDGKKLKYVDIDLQLLMAATLIESFDFSSGLSGVDRANEKFYELMKRVGYDFF